MDLQQISKQISADIDAYCEQQYASGHRTHLGASLIGHKCSRYLWYTFRWCFEEEFGGRMLRLFNRGHREEERFLAFLNGIDAEILDADEEQIRMSAVEGHFGGSRDGSIRLPAKYGMGNDPILVEFKTSGTGARFEELVRDGVKAAKPLHWAQMCTYGAGFGLKHALYICVNKNDDTLHVELAELDLALGRAMLVKADKIIHSQEPPAKIASSASYWECKYCPAKKICHLKAPAARNCRSCKFAIPVERAGWSCGYWGEIIPKENVPLGCDSYEAIA